MIERKAQPNIRSIRQVMSERSKKNETKHFPVVYKATTPQQNLFFLSFTNFGHDRVKATNSDGRDSVCNNEKFFFFPYSKHLTICHQTVEISLDLCLEYPYAGKIEQE